MHLNNQKRKNMKKYFIASFVLLFAFLTIACEQKPAEDKASLDALVLAADGKKAPDFTLLDTKGKKISLSDYKGKIVIVDFWATWCGPCRRGIPDLVNIQKSYKDKVVVIGISLDRETKEDVVPFMEAFEINYPIVFGTQKVTTDYGGVSAIPTSFVIDQAGNIVDKHVGLVDKATYTKVIDKLLKKS